VVLALTDDATPCPSELPRSPRRTPVTAASHRYLLPGRAGITRIDHEDRDVAVLGKRAAGTGQVTAALEPGIQLIEHPAAHLADLQVPESRLDRTADEARVRLPRRDIPLGHRNILVQELFHGNAGVGPTPVGGRDLRQKTTELDLRTTAPRSRP